LAPFDNGCWIAKDHDVDPLLISAASGMKARMESLDMLANNIANTGTAGFKADREFSGLFEEELPVIERQWTDFSQGTTIPTGNPLDLALSGKGFFALNSPSGVLYTRNGTFRISKANELATAEGYTLRNLLFQDRRPIKVDPTQPVDIGKDGVVTQGGQQIGQIEIDQVPSAADALGKLGTSYFALLDKTGAVSKAQDAEVLQGQLEQSNVPVADAAVRLIAVMRQFEMLQKAMTIGSEMNKEAITEVARVV
jgi:flagellar basal-body rod protein FlgF